MGARKAGDVNACVKITLGVSGDRQIPFVSAVYLEQSSEIAESGPMGKCKTDTGKGRIHAPLVDVANR